MSKKKKSNKQKPVVHVQVTNKTGKKKRKRKGKTASGGQVAVAAAYGRAEYSGNVKTSAVATTQDKELWASVGTSDTGLQQFDFRPGSTGLARLDNVARQYELWRAKRIRVFVEPECGTSDRGARYMALDYDSEDSGYTIPAQIGELSPSVTTPPWMRTELQAQMDRVNKGKWMFTQAGGASHPGLDAGFRLWIGTSPLRGTDPEVVTGVLFCEYEVEFTNPIIPGVMGKGITQRVVTKALPATPLNPGGLVGMQSADNGVVGMDGQVGVVDGYGGEAPRAECCWNLYDTAQVALSADGKTVTVDVKGSLKPGAKDCVFQYDVENFLEILTATAGTFPAVANQAVELFTDLGSQLNIAEYTGGRQGSSLPSEPFSWKRTAINGVDDKGIITTFVGYVHALVNSNVAGVILRLKTEFDSALTTVDGFIRLGVSMFTPGEMSASVFGPFTRHVQSRPWGAHAVDMDVDILRGRLASLEAKLLKLGLREEDELSEESIEVVPLRRRHVLAGR